MTTSLPAGSTIGIIGGGQLGRMLALSAARLGFHTIVLEPQENCPASQVTNAHIQAPYDDADGLAQLAAQSDVITYEFENIDVAAIEQLSASVAVYPGAQALRISQDRLGEKEFLQKSGLKTAPYRDITDLASLTGALEEFGAKGILKTRRFGYDGKGQMRFSGKADDLSPQQALTDLNGAAAILEGFVDFTCEISVIATRAQDGKVECFEPAENIHKNGILLSSTVPSSVSASTNEMAISEAKRLINALEYVGTLGLEFFVMADGSLVANEFAPRVHNSGHWTEAACAVSQFEQHIRACAGWPLARQHRHSDCVMENLLGGGIDRLVEIAADPGTVLHNYGKAEARDGRKMGHFTRLAPRSQR